MEITLAQILELDIDKFEKAFNQFLKKPKDFDKHCEKINKLFEEAKRTFIKNSLEFIDKQLCNSNYRKQEWYISRKDSKNLLTQAGNITFHKTLFKNKQTNESCYLLDKVCGFDSNERISDGAKTQILEEAVQTSYRRGGESICKEEKVSKQAVKNLIHSLEYPDIANVEAKKKRVVDYLYIEADEDHQNLQYKNDNHCNKKTARKTNGIIAKLAYVHEGIRPVNNSNKRNEIINAKYFTEQYRNMDNSEFWNRIYLYIINNYHIDAIKKIIIMGDGGTWIKAALDIIPNSVYVMDEYHLNKALNKLTNHFWDSAQDVKKVLRNNLRNNNYDDFIKNISYLKNVLDETEKQKFLTESKFFINNWVACHLRLKYKHVICGCSAEAHISHVLASRMSSRPMAWCNVGSQKMANLIEYSKNNKNMSKLVKFQKHAKHNNQIKESNEVKTFKKYYRAVKCKATRPLTHKEKIDKYTAAFSATTLPGKQVRNWLDKVVNF